MNAWVWWIPPVRALSRELDVSVSTTLEAYRLLEDRGLIDTKPQSGHYVRPLRLTDRFRSSAGTVQNSPDARIPPLKSWT